jgi:hypothetical protein
VTDATPHATNEVVYVQPVTPTDWTVYETPSGHVCVGIELDFPTLREEVAGGTAKCEGGGVATGIDGQPFSCPHAYVRMDGYDVYIPLEGAPTSWVKRAKREGFCLVLVPSNDEGQVPFLVTGAPEQGELSTPTGRNERCPCGSGRKHKRCHGAVDA